MLSKTGLCMADYDADFEAEVLATCLRDAKYLRDASRVLARRHFVVKEHGWAWRVISDTWKATTELTRAGVFKARVASEFRDEDEQRVHLEMVLKLFRREPSTPRSALEELRRFVRTADLQTAIEESVRHQERGDWDEAWDPIRNAVRSDVRKVGYQVSRWFEEFEERQRERRHRREHPELYRSIPTGFARLDRIITGAQEGELCGIMATTNRGKSVLAVNLGFNAIARGYNVIHFSTEMGHKKVAQRYDSRFTKYEYRKFKRFDFNDEELARIDDIIKRNRKKFLKRLRIISTPLRSCDIDLVRAATDDMRPEMPGGIDMSIIDSGDHMQARGRHEKQYQAEGSNFWDLKDYAEEEEFPVWVTLQAKAEFETKTATTRASAGAYDKSRICDLLISINEPSERSRIAAVTSDSGEVEQPAHRADLELYVAKYRDDESKFFIPIAADLKRMLIREYEEAAEEEAGEYAG